MTSATDIPSAPVDSEPRGFLDVDFLIDASEPRRPIPRIWFFLGGMVLVILFSGVLSAAAGQAQVLVEVLTGLMIVGLMIGLLVLSATLVKRIRADQQKVESIGELVQLKRWSEAAPQLDQYLSSPARTESARAQALVYLGAILARYQRFADAIAVYDYLLDSQMLDPGSNYGLQLGRAMAMLREDHLVDADRAISELRRQTPTGVDSAGLSLVELYRDIKTGHSDDAIERFAKVLPLMRQQLGHRTGDAWALVARAYDLMNRPNDARQAYQNATLLTPPAELSRRYPEIQKLEGKYQPSYAPAEAA